MPDKILQQRLYPYDGSQNSTKHPLLISPKDIIRSDNVIYTTYSTKKKRPGKSDAFDISPNGRPILGMVDYHRLGTQRVVYYDGKFLKAVRPSDNAVDNITGTQAIPLDEAVSFAKFYGYLAVFFQDETTPIQAWNQTGSVATLTSSEQVAKFGQVAWNRLWIPDPDYPGRLLVSVTNDPTDFVTRDAFAIDLDINDGDPDGITAITPQFWGSIYVMKRYATYRVSPVQTAYGTQFVPTKISDNVGCVSHNSVVSAGGTMFFPSDEGVHYFSSSDKVSEIETDLLSRDIQNDWRGDVNFRRAKYMWGHYDREFQSLLFTFPASSYNYPTDVWGYSLVAKKWYKWHSYNATSVAKYIDYGTKKVKSLIGGPDGRLGVIDSEVFTDYGEKIPPVTFVSGIISPTSLDEEFEFDYIAPIFVPQSSGTFNVKMKIDGRVVNDLDFDMTDTSDQDLLGEDFVLGASILGGIPEMKILKKRIGGHGMTYQLFIEHEQTLQEDAVDFELLGIMVDVEVNAGKTGARIG